MDKMVLFLKASITDMGCHDFHSWVDRHSPHQSPKLQNIVYKNNFLKMANIDALLEYNLSCPMKISGEGGIPNDERIHYIGDLWQGSKGFREYLTWKSSQLESQISTKILTMRTTGSYSAFTEVSKKTGT